MGSKRSSFTNLQSPTPSKALKVTDWNPVTESDVWEFHDRCRLAEALADEKIGKFSGLVRKYVGNKSLSEVTAYMKHLALLESGTVYKEFREKPAALDVWLELMEKTTRQDEQNAEQCIPQIMTVAALEPRNAVESGGQLCPNYSNVYNYLAMLLKGEEPVDLPPLDAKVVLHLLDTLAERFCNSLVMLQKEFLHDAYGYLTSKGDGKKSSCIENNQESIQPQLGPTDNNTNKLPSLNPLNVPATLLEFRKKKPIVIDFSTSWRTTFS